MDLKKDTETNGPLRARSDLVDILRRNPNAEAIVAVIESELRGIKDSKSRTQISNALSKAGKGSAVGKKVIDNVLFWLTETSPDVRQMILVRTIEDLLANQGSRDVTIAALTRVSSEDNVKTVMEWANRGILTMNQAVYVLLYPDSTAALR
ncbi:MAG: hypothetical protein C4K49_01535 [Candidatus Thorarchaeota archaeon]|nr:MAG: hypothetical protein C4K49_01535 [Candidatus Thorarchaeota archaeon]